MTPFFTVLMHCCGAIARNTDRLPLWVMCWVVILMWLSGGSYAVDRLGPVVKRLGWSEMDPDSIPLRLTFVFNSRGFIHEICLQILPHHYLKYYCSWFALTARLMQIILVVAM